MLSERRKVEQGVLVNGYAEGRAREEQDWVNDRDRLFSSR